MITLFIRSAACQQLTYNNPMLLISRRALLCLSLAVLPMHAMANPLSIAQEIYIPDVVTSVFEVPAGYTLSDAQLADLGAKLKRRKILGLSLAGHNEITDRSLSFLKGVPLSELNLDGTQVHGEGLSVFTGSLTMARFSAKKAPLENEAMATIATWKNLKTLNLKETRIDDAGLKHLQGLTQLQDLDLSDNDIKGDAFAQLQGLKLLKTLDLSGTQLMDRNLVYIRKFSGLQKLYLGNTKISNSGVEKLRGLPQLKNLNVNCTGVTNDGLAPFSYNSSLQTTNVCSE